MDSGYVLGLILCNEIYSVSKQSGQLAVICSFSNGCGCELTRLNAEVQEVSVFQWHFAEMVL